MVMEFRCSDYWTKVIKNAMSIDGASRQDTERVTWTQFDTIYYDYSLLVLYMLILFRNIAEYLHIYKIALCIKDTLPVYAFIPV